MCLKVSRNISQPLFTRNGFKFLTLLENKTSQFEIIVKSLSATIPPKIFSFKKSTDFISEKNISIDKILAFLQAFEHAISMFTTAQSGIWVGILVTSLWEPSWNTQETEGCQTFLGYFWFMFYRNRARFLRKRTVSSSITNLSLATIWTTAMYIYIFFHFEVRVASGDCRVVIFTRIRIDNLRSTWVITVQVIAVELTYSS